MRGQCDDEALAVHVFDDRNEVVHLAFVAKETQCVDAYDRGVAACKILAVGFGAVCCIYGHADVAAVLLAEHYSVAI